MQSNASRSYSRKKPHNFMKTASNVINLRTQRNSSANHQFRSCKRNGSIVSINNSVLQKFRKSGKKKHKKEIVKKSIQVTEMSNCKNNMTSTTNLPNNYDIVHWKTENKKYLKPKKNKNHFANSRSTQFYGMQSATLQKIKKQKSSVYLSTVCSKMHETEHNLSHVLKSTDRFSNSRQMYNRTQIILERYQHICQDLQQDRNRYKKKYSEAMKKLKKYQRA